MAQSAFSTYLVISKDKSADGKRFWLERFKKYGCEQEQITFVRPRHPHHLRTLPLEEWREIYAQYIEHMYEYIVWHLSSYEASATLSLRKDPSTIKESLTRYLYNTSMNKYKCYKFFK